MYSINDCFFGNNNQKFDVNNFNIFVPSCIVFCRPIRRRGGKEKRRREKKRKQKAEEEAN